jgi:hypothetical protein
MKRTILTTACLGAAAALALPAGAAPAKACFLVTDPGGDAKLLGQSSNLDAVDVLSADVATSMANVVGTVRLASVQRDALAPGGHRVDLSFTAGGVEHTFQYSVRSDGAGVASFSVGNERLGATAVVDAGSKSITWTVPRKSVTTFKKTGLSLTGLAVDTFWSVASPSGSPGSFDSSFGVDSAEGTKSYPDRAPSCLKA